VHVFAVGKVGAALLVDSKFDVVVVVQVDLDQRAATLRGGLLHYRLKFEFFHINKQKIEDLAASISFTNANIAFF
jgi:hypothetical protein